MRYNAVMPLEKFKPLPTIVIPKTSQDTLFESAAKTGETPENYLLGSLALVAVWGEAIIARDGTKRLLHGIIDTLDNSCEPINIRKILRFAEAEGNTEISSPPNAESEPALQIAVPLASKGAIDQAAHFYDTTIPKITHVAAGIRHELLELQDRGHLYAFSYDGRIWQPVGISRVLLGPSQN
jgi:hypothetical protein